MNLKAPQKLGKLIQACELLSAIGEEKSFSKAAQRLNVHQSAVSHRIKTLEEALGLSLFKRTTRKLTLTEEGEVLCAAALDTTATWTAALAKLERLQSSDTIRLSLSSSLAMKWLVPALPSAQKAGLDISIEVNDELCDFETHNIDAAIRFGHGPYPGLHSSHLAHCSLQPLASPLYLNNKTAKEDATLLNEQETTFLSDRRGKNDQTDFCWAYYFANVSDKPHLLANTFDFDRADLMLQAANNGMGIGLGRTLLIEEDIKSGFLTPIGKAVPIPSGYWLVCTPNFAKTRRFNELLDWLKQQVQRTINVITTS